MRSWQYRLNILSWIQPKIFYHSCQYQLLNSVPLSFKLQLPCNTNILCQIV
jgi:hypothetical protein